MYKKGGNTLDIYILIESGIRTVLSMFIGGLIGWERGLYDCDYWIYCCHLNLNSV